MGQLPVDGMRHFIGSSYAYGCMDSALFFADKLVSMSSNHEDLFTLATLFFNNREFKRALHLLMKSEYISVDKFKLLAARCFIEMKDWDGALNMIGEDNDPVDQISDGADFNLASAMCLLRGVAYEALENRRRSTFWFKQALIYDVRCYDAFSRLIHERMLSVEEERIFFGNLKFTPELQWLKELYSCEISQYDYSKQSLPLIIPKFTEYNLLDNASVVACLAQSAYNRNEFKYAYDVSKGIIEKNPYHRGILPIYICCLVELKYKSELFYSSHQLVESYSNHAISWFSVACYYYLIGRYDVARRYFSRASTVDSHFVPAIIGYGHSFAAQDESDQAMTAYRTAERIFKGSHIPILYLGLEYLRTNNLKNAQSFFTQSLTSCPTDPLIYNELGVVHFRNSQYSDAIQYFSKAIELIASNTHPFWEAVFFNIGHCFRKIGDYQKALEYYEIAKAIFPKNPTIHTSIGFTYHLQGDCHRAIDNYHKALGIHSKDMLTSDLLSRALSEVFSSSPT